MNKVDKDIAILKRLIIELDDARTFYATAGGKLAHSHLKYLIEEIAHLHVVIAEDLADRMRAGSVNPVRTGSALGRLRRRHAEWLAVTSPDIELGYLIQIDRCETRVARHFSEAAGKAYAVQQRLRYHQRELEHQQARVERMVQQIRPRQLAG